MNVKKFMKLVVALVTAVVSIGAESRAYVATGEKFGDGRNSAAEYVLTIRSSEEAGENTVENFMRLLEPVKGYLIALSGDDGVFYPDGYDNLCFCLTIDLSQLAVNDPIFALAARPTLGAFVEKVRRIADFIWRRYPGSSVGIKVPAGFAFADGEGFLVTNKYALRGLAINLGVEPVVNPRERVDLLGDWLVDPVEQFAGLQLGDE